MTFKVKTKKSKKKNYQIIETKNDFDRAVKQGMVAYAEKKGWKLKKNSSEPVFVKGKGEIHMHTEDGVIFSTIGGELGIPHKKPFAKQYSQDMNLFFGKYTNAGVKRYIEHGKKSLDQIDEKLPKSLNLLKEIKAKKKSQVNYAFIKGKGIQSFKGDSRSSKRPKDIVIWSSTKKGVKDWVKKYGTKAQKRRIIK